MTGDGSHELTLRTGLNILCCTFSESAQLLDKAEDQMIFLSTQSMCSPVLNFVEKFVGDEEACHTVFHQRHS